MDEDTYGRAWMDHASWLRQQGNSRRAGPERDHLYNEARKAHEIGLNAIGFHLPARLLPFDTGFQTGPTPAEVDAEPGVPPRLGGWVCRYCNRGEGTATGIRLPMSIRAERGRALTHEAMCPSRPTDRPVTDAERQAMADYLREWMKPRLDVIDEQIRMLAPRPGYRHTPDQTRSQLADWRTMRAELLAILTRCGVDDDQMATAPTAKLT